MCDFCIGLYLWYYVYCFFLFFFFKQKTAYEMRISDWSSDVCSSDLVALRARRNLTKPVWDYLTGGSESETTLRRNRLALDSLALRPNVLNDEIGRASCRERVCQYV